MDHPTPKEIEEFEQKRMNYLKDYNGTWGHNIPFHLVPVELVMGFRGAGFTPEEFYKSDIWRDPSHWNAGFVKDGIIAIFMYGTWQRLEKYLYVERIAAIKSVQSYGNDIWEMVLKEVDKIARDKKCKYHWTTTFRKGEVKKAMECSIKLELNPKSMMVMRRQVE